MDLATVRTKTLRYRERILHWTNVRREDRGIAPVRRDLRIEAYAQHWVERLNNTDLFYHSEVGDLLRITESGWASENLACIPNGCTPRQTVRLWMQSEGHRKNLLNPRADHVGIGAAWDESRECWLIAQCFTSID